MEFMRKKRMDGGWDIVRVHGFVNAPGGEMAAVFSYPGGEGLCVTPASSLIVSPVDGKIRDLIEQENAKRKEEDVVVLRVTREKKYRDECESIARSRYLVDELKKSLDSVGRGIGGVSK